MCSSSFETLFLWLHPLSSVLKRFKFSRFDTRSSSSFKAVTRKQDQLNKWDYTVKLLDQIHDFES